jgi:hypothetical protein
MFTRLPFTSTPLWRTNLARLGARGAETHAIGHGIEAAFQQLQQVLAGLTLAAVSFGVHRRN